MNPGVIDVDADGGTPLPRIRRAFAELSIGQVHYATAGARRAPAVLQLHQSPRSWMELLFLSFTTLSGVGIGDILPLRPQARALVMLEEFAGVGYIAAIVSRLIGLTVLRAKR